MIIPYSTDAPIYHFPWATIGLIVTNIITFLITLGGEYRWGWLLTYGDGLHPLEWVTWNFLHFGVMHLLGNMFFLWAFGIVVEGKLGWWKFLLVYLGIGTVAGFLIQVFMLRHDKEMIASHSPRATQTGYLVTSDRSPVQHGGVDELDDDDAMPIMIPDAIKFRHGDADELDEGHDEKIVEDLRFGAGGASAAIYGLMAIVLFWAPRNEVHCLWLMGFRGGAIEVEYLYFCGFYIFMEMVFAFYHTTRYEATSEVLHSSGAFVGAGVGMLFLRWNWVDCENWDLFSIMQGKHSAVATVGDWQSYYAASAGHRDAPISGLTESRGVDVTSKKKKKAKPRLVEISDMDDAFDAPSEELPKKRKSPNRVHDPKPDSTKRKPKPTAKKEAPIELEWIDEGEVLAMTPPPVPIRKPRPQSSKSSSRESTKRLRQLLLEGKFELAYVEYLDLRSYEEGYELPQEELGQLANGLFRSRAATEGSTVLAEYIERFPQEADRERVKLAVLNVRYLKRPMAALKLLAQINPGTLAEDYREIYRKTARYAQEMVASGVVDQA